MTVRWKDAKIVAAQLHATSDRQIGLSPLLRQTSAGLRSLDWKAIVLQGRCDPGETRRASLIRSSPLRTAHTAFSSMRSGIRRSRLPAAAKTAFAMAGPVSQMAASPSPCGSSWLSTKYVSSAGASGMRSTL